MKIYTKSGDKGKTSLVSGRRLSKSDVLIEAYGTVDELNAYTGSLIAKAPDDLLEELHLIQNILFNIGSLLAKDDADFPNYPTLVEEDVQYLEKRIDHFNEKLEKMTAFILPSGSEAIARAHICRTVCRRAERRVIMIGRGEGDDTISLIIQYLNRLSDYFFVLARYLHHFESVPEIKWDNKAREKMK